MQRVGGLFVERGDPDITDVAALGVIADRTHVDDLAGDRNVERGVLALAQDGELGLGIDRAFHLVDGLLERKPLHRVAVDLADQVARHDPGLCRRRVVDRRDHLDEALFHRDLDAEAAEFARRRLLHLAPGLVVHVARVRIERGHHAVDRTLHQLGVVGLLDVVGPDALEYFTKQIELRISIGRTSGSLGGLDQVPALRAGNEKCQARSGERAT